MTLVPLRSRPEAAKLLFELLAERPKEACISHCVMPTWEQHIRFIQSNPYDRWFLIEENPGIVGSIYLTKLGEIGVSIFKQYQGRGFAKAAILDLMSRFPNRRLLANVAPANEASSKLWESLGGKVVQKTYELRA